MYTGTQTSFSHLAAITARRWLFLGLPLVLPIVHTMLDEVSSLKDVSPVHVVGLLVASVTTRNSMVVVLCLSQTSKARLTGFTTGALTWHTHTPQPLNVLGTGDGGGGQRR